MAEAIVFFEVLPDALCTQALGYTALITWW